MLSQAAKKILDSRSYSWYRRTLEAQVMPYAFLDIELLDINIRDILDRCGSKTIRIASKSVRCRQTLRYILDSDPRIQGLMCYSGPEAVWLSEQGFGDLLLGYPVWERSLLQEICQAVNKGAEITCMIDSVAHVKQHQEVAASLNCQLNLCLDVDMSIKYPMVHFGVYRSPVRLKEEALKIWEAVKKAPNLKLTGVMGYEAQIAGVVDTHPINRMKNPLIRLLKSRSIPKIAKRRAEVVQALKDAGAPLTLVNGGGTGSLESTREEEAVTEITVGSGFYSSHLFDHYKSFKHLPAMAYAVEIVRIPQAGSYTAHGGGYVASGTPGLDKIPEVYLPKGAKLEKNEAAGEVQTPIHFTGKDSLALGDPIFLRHAKAGELSERFNQILILKDGMVVDQWPTYRGDGKCFL